MTLGMKAFDEQILRRGQTRFDFMVADDLFNGKKMFVSRHNLRAARLGWRVRLQMCCGRIRKVYCMGLPKEN